MFDQVNGLPVHVLVLHAAVVFVPLLALGAIVYGLVPRWRSRTGWAVVLLSVAAPVTTFVAVQSGERLFDRLKAQNSVSPAGERIIEDHMGYGELTLFFTLALGVVSLVMVFATLRKPDHRLPRLADLGLAAVMVVLAVLSGYFVFQTGDSGATAVWGTY